MVSIYRADGHDCTNGGITALEKGVKYLNLYAAGEVADAPCRTEGPYASANAFLVRGNSPGTVKIIPAGPDGQPAPGWSMFGGNFAHTSNAPFGRAVEAITGGKFYGAVAIHDRFE
jgi:hypothetical protein